MKETIEVLLIPTFLLAVLASLLYVSSQRENMGDEAWCKHYHSFSNEKELPALCLKYFENK